MTLSLTHVVYSRSSSGTAVLQVDGLEASGSTIEGTFSSWNEGDRRVMASEFAHDRPWLGKIVSGSWATAP
jgi:hypothetical protein